MSTILGISEDDMVENASGTSLHNTKLKSDAAAFDEIMEKLKVKLANPDLTRYQEIQLLKMVPSTWGIIKAADYFRVTTYLVTKACEVLKNDDIFGQAVPRTGRKLDQRVVDKVIAFCCDDEHTRIVPGRSEWVSIRKRLIKELYAEFRQKHPQHEISSSKFCALCLK